MEKLVENGKEPDEDHRPVVKIFTPVAGCAWLLQSVDPEDTDIAFGLCDLGIGHPEMGYVSISEIRGARGRLGLPPERDIYIRLDKTLTEYWRVSVLGHS